MNARHVSAIIAELGLILTYSAFFGCATSQNLPAGNPRHSLQTQNLTGTEILKLNSDEMVQFPATLVRRNSCIELFAQDDFRKFNGDGKFAIWSRFADGSIPNQPLDESRDAIVTGKMTFVKDVPDTSKTCGIATGYVFEITEIEYL